jgi:hypothetical protein
VFLEYPCLSALQSDALAFWELPLHVTGAAGLIEVSGLTLAVLEEEKEVGISTSLESAVSGIPNARVALNSFRG